VKAGSFPVAVGSALAAFALLFSQPARAQSADLPSPLLAPAIEPDLPSPAAPTNLALTGVAVTGVWYGGALGSSLIWSNAPWSGVMKIPFAGPWISLKDIECGNEPDCTTLLVVTRAVLMSIDGLGQAAGVAFVLESVFMPSSARAKTKEKSARSSLRPFPLVTADVVGVGLAGEL